MNGRTGEHRRSELLQYKNWHNTNKRTQATMHQRFLLVFYFLSVTTFLPLTATFSIADWIWKQKDDLAASYLAMINSGHINHEKIELPEVPFETSSKDERFLQEAQYFGLSLSSPLEKCQQSIVFKLKSSCSSLTEEQLGLFSVELLNCQLKYEGRYEFQCTEPMSLRACTSSMDQETWNSYQLMNNRARSLCVALRTAQFNAMTEMTINKLMASTKGHIESLQALKAEQETMSTSTDELVNKLNLEQSNFLHKQLMLKKLQMQTEHFVRNRLRDLAYERSLVSSIQRQLTATANMVSKKLFDANDEIEKRNGEWENHHNRLVDDTNKLHKWVKEIWQEIERGTEKMKSQHASTLQLNEATLQSLQAINASVLYFQNLFSTTHREINTRLTTIVETLGGSDNYINAITHFGYLFLSMLLIAFVGAPYYTKVILILLLSLNISILTTNVAEAPVIPLPAVTFLIVFGTLVFKTIGFIIQLIKTWTKQSSHTVRPVPMKGSFSRFKNLELWTKLAPFLGYDAAKRDYVRQVQDDDDSSSDSDSGLAEESEHVVAPLVSRQPNLVRRSSVSSRQSQNSTPSRAGTPTRPLCSATCVNGQPCRMFATTSQGTCSRHSS
ncbi:protein brambleberry-like isoform X1 [Cloeon dipterum]|uniref:protein brambleberry-like isoform X1 n=2 Tax=Cloeon dipterum TaxID=197152 RepID=UPI00321FE1CD